jgi:hypothetical protein
VLLSFFTAYGAAYAVKTQLLLPAVDAQGCTLVVSGVTAANVVRAAMPGGGDPDEIVVARACSFYTGVQFHIYAMSAGADDAAAFTYAQLPAAQEGIILAALTGGVKPSLDTFLGLTGWRNAPSSYYVDGTRTVDRLCLALKQDAYAMTVSCKLHDNDMSTAYLVLSTAPYLAPGQSPGGPLLWLATDVTMDRTDELVLVNRGDPALGVEPALDVFYRAPGASSFYRSDAHALSFASGGSPVIAFGTRKTFLTRTTADVQQPNNSSTHLSLYQ